MAQELTQYVTALNVKQIRLNLDKVALDTWVQFVLPKTITNVEITGCGYKKSTDSTDKSLAIASGFLMINPHLTSIKLSNFRTPTS